MFKMIKDIENTVKKEQIWKTALKRNEKYSLWHKKHNRINYRLKTAKNSELRHRRNYPDYKTEMDIWKVDWARWVSNIYLIGVPSRRGRAVSEEIMTVFFWIGERQFSDLGSTTRKRNSNKNQSFVEKLQNIKN